MKKNAKRLLKINALILTLSICQLAQAGKISKTNLQAKKSLKSIEQTVKAPQNVTRGKRARKVDLSFMKSIEAALKKIKKGKLLAAQNDLRRARLSFEKIEKNEKNAQIVEEMTHLFREEADRRNTLDLLVAADELKKTLS